MSDQIPDLSSPVRGRLTAEGIRLRYRSGPLVLDGVDLAVNAGEILVVLGPNGAGKSSLVRVLAGLLACEAGVVRLDGMDLLRVARAERTRRIALVPQRPELGAGFDVRSAIGFGRSPMRLRAQRGADERAVDRAIERTGLSGLEGVRVDRLSVGQQQRVSLARALAQLTPVDPGSASPRFLLADEPFSAMDPAVVARCMTLVREEVAAGAGGLGVVMILHDPVQAAIIADRALLLDRGGRVAASGPVAEVLSPEPLGRVFGIGFERIATGDGSVVVPRLSIRPRVTRAKAPPPDHAPDARGP